MSNVQMEGGTSPSKNAYIVIYNHPKIGGQLYREYVWCPSI